MLRKFIGALIVASFVIGGCAEAGPDVASADQANAAIKNASNEEWFNGLKSAPLSMDQKMKAINDRNMSEEDKKKFIEELKSGGASGPAGAAGR